jgi:hypothetical protein
MRVGTQAQMIMGAMRRMRSRTRGRAWSWSWTPTTTPSLLSGRMGLSTTTTLTKHNMSMKLSTPRVTAIATPSNASVWRKVVNMMALVNKSLLHINSSTQTNNSLLSSNTMTLTSKSRMEEVVVPSSSRMSSRIISSTKLIDREGGRDMSDG